MLEAQFLPILHNATMNDIHFESIQHINVLSMALNQHDVDATTQAFETLLQHTKAHYAHEEAMMLEKKFPPYMAHKEEHEASLVAMQAAADAFASAQDLEAATHYLNQQLIPEFLKHTETMDAVTAIFLENSEAHLPYWERLVPRNP